MIGLDVFKKDFIGYEECFVIIGGTACSVLLNEIGREFRTTKDIDMVLITENISDEFISVFWKFIKNGRYRINSVGDIKRKFYRFEKTENECFPAMIELFSRSPIDISFAPGSHIIPLHFADDISSLSAILLNDDYYQFLLNGKKLMDGITLLDEVHLIPFKAKAWCELHDRQLEGEESLSKQIKKHKKDIAVLLSVITPSKTINLTGMVLQDMIRFEKEMEKEEINEMTTGVCNMTTQLYCSILKSLFNF